MRRMQGDETHPLPDARNHPLDRVIANRTMRGMSPPQQHVSVGQGFFSQTMLGIMQGRALDLESPLLAHALRNRALHSVRVNLSHEWIFTLVHILSPDQHSKSWRHPVHIMRRLTEVNGDDALRCKAIISGCRASFRRARVVRSRPGRTLCHGDAPEGWGRGIR